MVEDSRSGIEAALAARMEVMAYLGGGHAKAQWYIEAIRSYDIPIAYTQDAVFDYVNDRLAKWWWLYDVDGGDGDVYDDVRMMVVLSIDRLYEYRLCSR